MINKPFTFMFAEAAVMKSSRSAVARGVETNYSDQSVSGECIRVMVCSLPSSIFAVYTLVPCVHV